MDSSQYTSSLAELRQIQVEAQRSRSLDELRRYYERVHSLRDSDISDFDLEVVTAEIVERARVLSGGAPKTSAAPRASFPKDAQSQSGGAAEIPPEVERLDAKTWQRATYLGLLFTALVFGLFFYLVQTARKVNFPSEESKPAPAAPAAQRHNATAPVENASTPPVSMKPTLRLYTDLVPGTVSIDDNTPQDLKDGELVLDNLEPGRHSIKVTGHSGDAGFSYDVAEKSAPRVVGLPVASNAMAVLVSEEDGKARLITNAEHSEVSLDGKPAGEVGPDGLTLENLGKTDHDLQVTQDKDRQRFVLTYTSAPALTVYVKSDPNAGTVVVMAGQDGADVYIDDKPYRRKTDHGQLRIPLKVGKYTLRVHKAGFIDPPPQTVEVKKAEEAPMEFHFQPVPQIASLQIKGALPGTMVYLDKELAASIGPDGNANISNVKPGDHEVELERDQALSKRFQRTFHTGDQIVLSGPDVELEKAITDNKSVTPPPAPTPAPAPESTAAAAPNYSMELEGEQVRKGGGFVHYHVPKVAGHYTFAAQGRIGGVLKHSKLQWYAGYEDSENYILFMLDGKHAIVREVRDGKSKEINKIPFDAESNQWVQVDLSVRPHSIDARVKTPGAGWNDLGTVSSAGSDFTQDKVGFYVPGNDEIAVSNFRFSNH